MHSCALEVNGKSNITGAVYLRESQGHLALAPLIAALACV